MKVLSIKQPWAWAITNLPEPFRKHIENRTRTTKFRGRFLVHASQGFDAHGYERMTTILKEMGYTGEIPNLSSELFIRDAIIGASTLFTVTEVDSSAWFDGPYGYKLQNTILFDRPLPYKGALFSNFPDEELPQLGTHSDGKEIIWEMNKMVAAIIKGLLERDDGRYHFGSTGAYAYYLDLTYKLGFVRQEHDALVVTGKGRDAYETLSLKDFKTNRRAVSWDWFY